MPSHESCTGYPAGFHANGDGTLTINVIEVLVDLGIPEPTQEQIDDAAAKLLEAAANAGVPGALVIG